MALSDYLLGSIHRFSVLFHIATETPVNYWIGDGDLELPGDDDLDPSGLYLGGGYLTGLPAFRQLVGGAAEQVTTSFSGVDTIPRAWINDPNSDIVGSLTSVGLLFFDANLQIATPVLWVWTGTNDVPSLTMGMTRTIALTSTSEMIDRANAGVVMWNNSAHLAEYPGDRFLEVTALNSYFTAKWPE